MAGTYLDLPAGGGGGVVFITAVLNTDSINLTVGGGILTADLNITTQPATVGSLLSVVTIDPGVGGGLHVENPFADTTTDGVLSAVDWNIFNNKEPAITAGTTSDFWRGDKTFQLLETNALTAVTSGVPAAAGKIGEILTALQPVNTGVGIAASGTFGQVVSLPLTAGAYAISGTAGLVENGAVLTDGFAVGVSSSATGVGLSEFDTSQADYLISSTSDALVATPVIYVDIAAPTTYYLNTKFNYTAGSPLHRGKLQALRLR